MELLQYNPQLLPIICRLHKRNKCPYTDSIVLASMPKHGYIAIEHGRCLAAGFIRLIEGGYCQIDTLVSNPNARPGERNRALKTVVDRLIQDAKGMGIKGIVSWTDSHDVVRRAVSIGFRVKPTIALTLQL